MAVSRQKLSEKEQSEEKSDISFSAVMEKSEKHDRRKTIRHDMSSDAVLIRKKLIDNLKKQVSVPFPGTVLKRKTTIQKMKDECEYKDNMLGTASLFSQYLPKHKISYE